MKPRKIAFISAFILMCVFSIIGVTFTVALAHEYFHKADFKSVAEDGEIALFIIPDNASFMDFVKSPFAYYSYNVKAGNLNQQIAIEKNAEFRAYAVTFGLGLVYLLAQSLIIKELAESEWKE